MKAKKPPSPRKKKVKVDLNELPSAVYQNTFLARLHARVAFERTLSGKVELHIGEVWGHDKELGEVTVWDETREQFFCFNVSNPPKICVLDKEDLTESIEVIELRDELKRAKLHLKFLEEKIGALYIAVPEETK